MLTKHSHQQPGTRTVLIVRSKILSNATEPKAETRKQNGSSRVSFTYTKISDFTVDVYETSGETRCNVYVVRPLSDGEPTESPIRALSIR